ncbi:MAG: PQQ-binding-like beta-propeller repeat protein [Phycisphaeraceae bacterium]|jgi:outer membrane protein assembly factor BamB|nr:PQQ-binding-like beta-propeller repeat protein [Phycisphaeraceae bacterium]
MSMIARLIVVLFALTALCACGEESSAPPPESGTQTAAAPAPGGVAGTSTQIVTGWLHWRGPHQNGTSDETGLPDKLEVDGDNQLWTYDLKSRGTPVIAKYGPDDTRVFAWGYAGDGTDLREYLVCLNADTGDVIWRRGYSDFISDIIYDRYAIGSPTVDAETGNIFLMTSPGLLVCLDRDGNELWQVSMMEQFGRLTFPNGRTGAPSIFNHLVIVNAITTNWGREGPARNRFYAFDKKTGELTWSSTPGVGPPFLKDSSFCSPYFARRGDAHVFYVGTGCGNVAAVNALTGDPLWRFQLAIGGINSSVVVNHDTLVAIHGKENVDDTKRGRMVGLNLASIQAGDEQQVLDTSAELWRNDLDMFTSSPVLVDDRVYQVTYKGELACVSVDTGEVLWHHELGQDQLHASPLYADSKLYIPTWHDGLYIIRPLDDYGEVLDQAQLKGACIGSPAVFDGKLYVHTMDTLYCFVSDTENPRGKRVPRPARWDYSCGSTPTIAEYAELQPVPAEVLMRPGKTTGLRVEGLYGKACHETPDINPADVQWARYIPPTAKVKAELNADFNDAGELVASDDANPSAGAFEATYQSVKGYIRGRILPSPPYVQDFDAFKLKATAKDGSNFAYPPLPWIGARLKWEVRDLDGNQVLAKTLDRVLFQRSMIFMGHADDAHYTIEADVRSDGNRRIMSTVGVINQRYIIALIGNAQILEISSNHDRLKVSVPFKWKMKTWYTLKTRVDVQDDDDESVVIRAKAWLHDETEPNAWTIETTHKHGHRQGSPGLFGFSPQSKFKVYVDNVRVTPTAN